MTSHTLEDTAWLTVSGLNMREGSDVWLTKR